MTVSKFSFAILLGVFAINNLSARILNDKVEVNVRNEKMEFIRFDFERKTVAIIENEEDLAFFKSIEVPFIFDPTRIFHTPKIVNSGYFYNNIRLEHFNVTYNGQITEDLYLKTDSTIQVVQNRSRLLGDEQCSFFTCNSLKIGDTLEFDTRYFLVFYENLEMLQSYRMFFNSPVPIDQYELTITHQKNLDVKVSSINTTFMDSTQNKGVVKYVWKMDHLKENILEHNSRPYKSLPHIVLNVRPEIFSYKLPNDALNLNAYTIASANALIRESELSGTRRSVSIGAVNKGFTSLYKYVRKFQDSLKVGDTYQTLLQNIQTDLTENFRYSNSYQHFKQNSLELNKFWKIIRDKDLPEVSKMHFYAGILERLNLTYFSGYLADKRSGVISPNYTAPMLTDNYCWAPILEDNSVQLMWPKCDNINLYQNELPFYFEKTKMLLMHPKDFLVHRTKLESNFNTITTPSSNFSGNQRNHNVLIEVDVKNKIANAKAKVSLQGQYSTLTRSLYKDTISFENINPCYNTIIKDTWVTDDFAVKDQETQSFYPFQTKVNASANLAGHFNFSQDSILLSVKGLINHITTPISSKRDLDYYFDFLGSDSYNYIFQFSTNVKLNNPLNISLESNGANYVFNIMQIGPNLIRLTSKYSSLKEKISNQEYPELAKIFEAIEQNNDYVLNLKLTE